MSFEDDMIEDGFNNEMDYLEYLMDIDDQRRENIPSYDDCDYEYCPSPIDKDRKIICRNNKYGVVDNNYKTIIKFLFNDISADGSYFICHLNNGYYTELNRNGYLYEFVDGVEYSCKKKYDFGIQFWASHQDFYLICKDQKYGCLFWNESELKFHELLPCKYEHIDLVDDAESKEVIFIQFCVDNLWGLYNIRNNKYFEARFEQIHVDNGYICALLNGIYDVYDFDYNFIRHDLSDSPLKFSEGLSPICKNGLWGYVDSRLNIVISPTYQKVFPFILGVAKVSSMDMYGMINTEGDIVLEIIYDEIENYNHKGNRLFGSFNDSLIWAKYKGKWGLIDRSGNPITLFAYDSHGLDYKEKCYVASYFDKDVYDYKVQNGSHTNFLNDIYYNASKINILISFDGKLLVPSYGNHKIDKTSSISLNIKEYTWISPFFPLRSGNVFSVYDNVENQVAIVKSWNGKMGGINRDGEFVIPCIYDYLCECDISYSKIIIARLNNKYGCINSKGEIIIPLEAGHIKYDSHAMGGKPLYVDGIRVDMLSNNGFVFGNILLRDITCCIPSGFEHVYFVKKGGKWGAISKDGIPQLDYIYDNVRPAKFGLAAVCLNDKWGFVDNSFQEIIPHIYDRVDDFKSLGLNDTYELYIREGKWTVSSNINFPTDNFEGYMYASDLMWEKYNQAVEENDDIEIEYWSKKIDKQLEYDFFPQYTSEYKRYLKELRVLQDNSMAISVVSLDGLKSVINRCGETLIKPIYREVEISKDWRYSIFKVKLHNAPMPFNNKCFTLNYNGKCQIDGYTFPEKYDAVIATKCKNLYLALSNNKVGIVNDKGRCVLPCKYKRIKILNKHSAIVYTLKGNKIIDICNQ